MPSPPVQLPGDPFPVAFPREPFSANDHRKCISGKGFQFVNPAHKSISEDVCGVSALSQPAQFVTKIMIPYSFVFQKPFEIVPVEGRDLAFWDTPDIDECLDSMREENFDKILFASPVGSEGKNTFSGFHGLPGCMRARSKGHGAQALFLSLPFAPCALLALSCRSRRQSAVHICRTPHPVSLSRPWIRCLQQGRSRWIPHRRSFLRCDLSQSCRR